MVKTETMPQGAIMGLFGPLKPFKDGDVHQSSHKLVRSLSWPHLIALGIGAIVGMGIFTLTGIGAGVAGPSVIISFAIAGIICACAALAYAEVSTLIPASGSAYTYTYSILGEGLAWVVGWSLILEYAVGCAAVATGWSAHMSGLLHSWMHFDLPTALRAGLLDHDPANGGIPGGVINLLAGVIALVVTALLLLGTRESATVNIVLVLIKMVALGAFVLLAAPAIRPEHYHPFMPNGFWPHEVNGQNVGVLAAAAIMFFAFYGFDAVSTSAEETKNPGRDLTIGIIGSMAVCTILYMLVAGVAIGAVPFMDLAKTGEPLPYALHVLNQPFIGDLVGVAAVLAMPSVLLVFMYGQSRILFVMARDGLIPAGLAKVNGRGVPVAMTLITGIFVTVFAALVPLKKIAEFANSGTLAAFVAVSVAMIIMRFRHPELKRNFRTPVFWLVGAVAIIGCIILFFSLSQFTQVFFLIWNAIGLGVYFLYGIWNSKLRKSGRT